MITKAYKLHTVGAGAAVIDGIQNYNINSEHQPVFGDGSGVVDPLFIATMLQEGSIDFNSLNLKAALDLGGINGLPITASALLTLFFKKYLKGGTIDPGPNHLKVTINEGLMIPRTLSGSQGSEATIQYDIRAITDGTNDPLVFADGQNLAGDPAEANIWTIGNVQINGVDLEVSDINVDFGINEFRLAGNGDAFPSFVSIENRQPTITIGSMDLSQLGVIPARGIPLSEAMVFYFRKLAPGGTRFSDVSAVHIKLIVNKGQVLTDNASASKGDQASSSVIIRPINDGVNDIIVLDTASAIT